jgi:hypothetical protein
VLIGMSRLLRYSSDGGRLVIFSLVLLGSALVDGGDCGDLVLDLCNLSQVSTSFWLMVAWECARGLKGSKSKDTLSFEAIGDRGSVSTPPNPERGVAICADAISLGSESCSGRKF